MSTLADALKKYLTLRRKLGSKLRGVDSGLRNFVAFAKREALPTSRRNWRWAGPRNQLRHSPQPGRLASGWCDASPSGSARQTDAPKYPP